MKLTYLTWGYPHDTEIIRAFREFGLKVDTVGLPRTIAHGQGNTQEKMRGEVSEEPQGKMPEREADGCDVGNIIFSVNFFAPVSDFCQREGIPYCCWVLQLPNFDLYTAAVINACNYIGLCDSYLVEKLWQLGIGKAFFLPDAVELKKPEDTERETGQVTGEDIGAEKESDKEASASAFEREACFVARHPEESLYTEGMTLYGKGYLDAFLHAQRILYGACILEDGLLSRVQREFLSCNPTPKEILPELEKLYTADRYFAPVCTALQQNIFLQNYESIMTIYSDGEFSHCKSVKHPYAEEETRRWEIYAGKEFTLVLAPHVMHNGIPREALEVIAAGGFPVCGFQKDYGYFFIKDENLACFTSDTEFSQTIVRYGNSSKERERVREAAYRTVEQGHTYRHRVETMLDMWERL